MSEKVDAALLTFMDSDLQGTRTAIVIAKSPKVRVERNPDMDFPNREAYRRHLLEFPSDYIVKTRENAGKIKEYLDLEGVWYLHHETLSTFTAEVKPSQLKALSEMDEVASICANHEVSLP